jgi:hypothetical protein
MGAAEDILNKRGGGDLPNLRDFVGQTITIVSAEPDKKKNFDGVSFVAEAGDEVVEFWTSASAVVQKLTELSELDADPFPIEVDVISGPSAYGRGKEWIDIVPVGSEG